MKNSSVLITGGTGSIGQVLIDDLLDNRNVRRLAIFSRDELKQASMKAKYSHDPRVRWFIGDIRDLPRLTTAFYGVDYVIHAAALKQVDTGEYNPMEFIKTNILGSQNVIDAAINSGVKKVIALSTDKASSPINLYGATKLTADKLFISANNYSIARGTSFSVVRYGNVLGSRGSVIPLFLKLAREDKPLPITDKRMTRFWISIEEAVKFIIESFELMKGGELYVPRFPSMRLIDLANAISPENRIIESQIRPGEKLHEEMISADDSRRTILLKDRFIVSPVVAEWGYKEPAGVRMPEGKAYKSDTNEMWVSKEDLMSILKKFQQ